MYTPKDLTAYNLRQVLSHMEKQRVSIADRIAALREVLAELEAQ